MRSLRALFLAAVAVYASATLYAQNEVHAVQNPNPTAAAMPADADPAFEVASIRENNTGGSMVLVSTQGGRYVAHKVSLLALVKFAYRLQDNQILGLPSWADEKTYDISAVMTPEGRPTFDQIRVMLQKMLADRFQLKSHNEQRPMPVYILSVLKSGSKLKPSTETAAHDIEKPVAGGMEFIFYGATTNSYVNYLQQAMIDRPVIDRTGLTGKYDFDVTFLPEDGMFGGRFHASRDMLENAAPSFFTAIQDQLGLKLTADKAPVNVLVVDHAAEPSEN